jgi:hypothetical protein
MIKKRLIYFSYSIIYSKGNVNYFIFNTLPLNTSKKALFLVKKTVKIVKNYPQIVNKCLLDI